MPNFLSTGAIDEDVCVSFQNTLAMFAARILTWLDVSVKEVSPGVEPTMVEKPTKKLDFCWQSNGPNPDDVRSSSCDVKRLIRTSR